MAVVGVGLGGVTAWRNCDESHRDTADKLLIKPTGGPGRRPRPADISAERQPLTGRQLIFESCRHERRAWQQPNPGRRGILTVDFLACVVAAGGLGDRLRGFHALGPLVVAGGDRAERLEPVDGVLDLIAAPVDRCVEASGPAALAAPPLAVGSLVPGFRNRVLDLPASQVPAVSARGIRVVSPDVVWSGAWASAARPASPHCRA